MHVEPIFLPTGNDAVLSGSYRASLKMAYVQHKRHAWGSSDVPYAILKGIAHPEIPLRTNALVIWSSASTPASSRAARL